MKYAHSRRRRVKIYILKLYNPPVKGAHSSTPIEHIAYGPAKAKLEIVCLRKEVKRLTRKLVRKEFIKEMEGKGVSVSRWEGERIRRAVNHMNDTIEYELGKGRGLEA